MLYSTSFALRVATPDRVILDEAAAGVRVPTPEGPFEVLARHAPVVSALEVGEVRVSTGDGGSPTRRYLAISGGVIEVRRDGVSVLADSAEWAEDIDADRAADSRRRAAERLRNITEDIDSARAHAALARALTRLQVVSRAR
ncbi:ATP synthase F1 subunit epsilon [Candidatus Poribacteria bacterium]|jgi:F-type H+-transporting ATPase subunit epsilon|nr:ATP synthase F1 subunit epsilon [Candidatus Poribacteria bacterium]MBT5534076.1 ATP synthase F1 subunit epsilon [Candidatus Poribacteria bacterium]MBT5709472.1 ATP synthase F1 subunit epsilon [Candidatus Poribacteria bacterium]MBT7096953.1 ATP synthase F1 subunit epsilon [Candidatus Poribacteria bacterium]MBT7808355.1 ATP synthase F1 subunit epsilon [Candidatus Poribacteria bacterium]